MEMTNSISFYNCQTIDVKQIPVVPINTFRNSVIEDIASGKRLVSLFTVPSYTYVFYLYAIIADDKAGKLSVLSSEVYDKFPSLTPDCTQAHLFEREIAEQWAITPEGHPWLKPVRFHKSYINSRDAWNRKKDEQIKPSVMDFFQVEGEQIHEVAVGPVHAGSMTSHPAPSLPSRGKLRNARAPSFSSPRSDRERRTPSRH